LAAAGPPPPQRNNSGAPGKAFSGGSDESAAFCQAWKPILIAIDQSFVSADGNNCQLPKVWTQDITITWDNAWRVPLYGKLTEVQGNINVDKSFIDNTVAFSTVQKVSGDVIIENMPNLKDITLDLTDVEGRVIIRNNKFLTAIKLDNLRSADKIVIENNGNATEVSLASLQTVAKGLSIENHPVLEKLIISSLTHAADISIKNNPLAATVDLSSLKGICLSDEGECTGPLGGALPTGGLTVFGNDMIDGISAPLLSHVHGAVKIGANAGLTTLSFSKLHTITETLDFGGHPKMNTKLSSIFAKNLSTRVVQFYPSGQSTADDVCKLLRLPAFTSFLGCVNEASSTTGRCGSAFSGQNVTIKNGACKLPQYATGASFTPEGLKALLYVDIKTVQGTLTVTGVTDLIMPQLQEVWGGLAISGSTVQHVSLPKLEQIGNVLPSGHFSNARLSVQSASELTTLDLPSLVSMGKNCTSSCGFSVSSNAKLAKLNVPRLERSGGRASTSADFVVTGNPLLEEVALPQLKELDGNTFNFKVTSNAKLQSVDLTMLNQMGRDITERGNGKITFDISNNDVLSSVALTTVRSIGESCNSGCSFSIKNNPLLSRVGLENLGEFAAKASSGHTFVVENNPLLQTLSVNQLSALGSACTSSCKFHLKKNGVVNFRPNQLVDVHPKCTTTCEIIVSDNNALESFDIGGANNISSVCGSSCKFWIKDNAKLTSINAKAAKYMWSDAKRPSNNHVFNVENNTALQRIDLSGLTTLGGSCTGSCEFKVLNNPKLNEFDVKNMEYLFSKDGERGVTGGTFNVWFQGNSALEQFRMTSLRVISGGCTSGCFIKFSGLGVDSNKGLATLSMPSFETAGAATSNAVSMEIYENPALVKIEMSYFLKLGYGASSSSAKNNLMIHHNPKLNALAIGDKAASAEEGFERSGRAYIHVHTNQKLNSVETCSLVRGSNAIGKPPTQPCCMNTVTNTMDPGICPFYSSGASGPSESPCGVGSCV